MIDQAGKKDPKLTVAQAQQLLSVNQIETLIGCLPAGSPIPKAESDLLDLGAVIDGLSIDKGLADDLGNRVEEAGKQLAVGNVDAALSSAGRPIQEDHRTAGEGQADGGPGHPAGRRRRGDQGRPRRLRARAL